MHLTRGTTGQLLAVIQSGGLLVAPDALSFTIHDISTAENEAERPQVYPAEEEEVGVPRELGVGRFAADWEVPTEEPLGRHSIRWSCTMPDDTEVVWWRDFDVIAEIATPGVTYALASDLRAEGIDATIASDRRLVERLVVASRFVDRFTRRSFAPTYKTLRLDGTGSKTLLLSEPIVGLESVTEGTVDVAIDGTVIRPYARHLDGLTDPDDRVTPKLIHADGNIFPSGDQNIVVVGVFGYTEVDGSPSGKTPEDIVYATILRAWQEVYAMVDVETRASLAAAFRVTKQKTRDQEIAYAAPRRGEGAIGDDAVLEELLLGYRRIFGAKV